MIATRCLCSAATATAAIVEDKALQSHAGEDGRDVRITIRKRRRHQLV